MSNNLILSFVVTLSSFLPHLVLRSLLVIAEFLLAWIVVRSVLHIVYSKQSSKYMNCLVLYSAMQI